MQVHNQPTPSWEYTCTYCAGAYTQTNVCRHLHMHVNTQYCENITIFIELDSLALQSKLHLCDYRRPHMSLSELCNYASEKLAPSWVRELWSHGKEGDVLPIADCTKGHLVLKPCMHEAVVFLQQAHMFCPIFLSTIPPYIRPVISWVVTVRAHCASALTLLHQATEGEQWREGEEEGERKTLLYFSVPERHEVSVWCEREVGGSESGRRGVVGLMQAGVITYIDSRAESLLHKTLSRFSSKQLSLWQRGKTCKQWNNMHVVNSTKVTLSA